MRLKQYINEKIDANALKKEILDLKKSQKMGKLTKIGKKKLEKLENKLISMGIFNF
jgi:hypothetical protein